MDIGFFQHIWGYFASKPVMNASLVEMRSVIKIGVHLENFKGRGRLKHFWYMPRLQMLKEIYLINPG